MVFFFQVPKERIGFGIRGLRRAAPTELTFYSDWPFGTISRRIFQRGQFFPQFLGRQLEELPEAQVGELQSEQAVRRLTLAMPDPELTQVPVQALQVQ